MKTVWVLFLVLSAVSVYADPPVVREALDLELDGRLGEALERYRAALVSEPSLVQDETAAQDLTVRVLVKAAYLSMDLGYGEEASDFASRLSASKNVLARQQAPAVRLRLTSLQGQGSAVFDPGPPWLSGVIILPSAADAIGLAVQDSVRIQLGAFKDWSNALTLIDMLREKGWSPLTDVKTSANGDRLHVVYVVSREPAQDRSRLAAQGLLDNVSR
jgi:hypothetical protein